MSPVTLLALGWSASAVVMTLLWAWHLRLRNAGVVDVGWTLSVGGLGVLYAATAAGDPARRAVVGVMFGVWATRLAWYLLRDRVIGRPEDARYADLRARGSYAAAGRFFLFFQAQAAIAVLLSYPAWIASINPASGLTALELTGIALWMIGLIGETVADAQLEAFKAQPGNRGRTCREGLWRYSRHPNYFFEWLVWVAFAMFAAASPYGWVAVCCPLLMLYLLFRVTGIPATEAQALRTRGDDYRSYQATTSAFVPWFPRSAA
jgi:steroid 5-alpha reductase family enzyme